MDRDACLRIGHRAVSRSRDAVSHPHPPNYGWDGHHDSVEVPEVQSACAFGHLAHRMLPQNGKRFQSAVGEHAQRWRLPAEFMAWLTHTMIFVNIFVDRLDGYHQGDSLKIHQIRGHFLAYPQN